MRRLRALAATLAVFLAPLLAVAATIWAVSRVSRPPAGSLSASALLVSHRADCPCVLNRKMIGQVKSVVHTNRTAWDEPVSPPIVHIPSRTSRKQSDMRTSCGADAKKPLPSEQ